MRRAPAERRIARPARHLALLAGCALADALASVATLAAHVPGGPQLAPQVAAPPPLALFADLRWLLVYERSWPLFALEAAAFLAGRSALTALQASLAWPAGAVRRPRFSVLLRRAVVFDLVAGVLLAPFALLLYAFAAFPVSWLFFAAAPAAIILSLLLAGGWMSRGAWRTPAPVRLAGWTAAVVATVSAAGAVATVAPAAPAVLSGATAGLVEGLAWLAVGRHLARREAAARPRRGAAALAALASSPALTLAFLAGALAGASAGFSSAGALRPSGTAARLPPPGDSPLPERREVAAARRGEHVVVVVNGFSSSYLGDPAGLAGLAGLPPSYVTQQFSYRGMSRSGAPLPYGPAATHAALGRLTSLLAAQVATDRRRSGRPVDVVAISEGSALAEALLAGAPDPPLGAVVLVSPLERPGRVGYPAAGSGWGVAAGGGLQALGGWLGHLSGSVDLSPDQPFLRSLVRDASMLTGARRCLRRCAGLREAAIVPLADAVGGAPSLAGVPTAVVPGFHGGNLTDPLVEALVADVLAGRPWRSDRGEALLDQAIAAVSSAWRVPSLPAGTASGRLPSRRWMPS